MMIHLCFLYLCEPAYVNYESKMVNYKILLTPVNQVCIKQKRAGVYNVPYPPPLGGVYQVCWGRISSCEYEKPFFFHGAQSTRNAAEKLLKKFRGIFGWIKI